MTAFYNEIEPYAASWLENLIAAGHIAPGVVERRSITDLTPADCSAGQCHFFAGIGVWSAALRLAGWPDDVPVWTGSCPCQPFSSAGRRKGFDDSRHLWPIWFNLIRERRPAVVLGEQVASPDGLAWLDAVRADLEAAGYAFGASDLPAAGVGAPHIRQRLYFVAIANGERRERLGVQLRERRSQQALLETSGCRSARDSERHPLADTDGARCGTGRASETGDGRDEARIEPAGLRDAGFVGDASIARTWRDTGAVFGAQTKGGSERQQPRDLVDGVVASSATRGFWSPCDWISCRDGKARPVEPGTFPLAHGATARMGRLRAYGNAIVRPLAATFVRAVMESLCA